MNAQNWQKVKELFAQALDEPTANRLNFLRANCNGDRELYAEVKSLIEASAEPESLIEQNALNLAAKLGAKGKNYDFAKFGRYTVLREIGRGGLGAVFLAERSDGEFEQKVALKIIRQTFVNAEIERHFRRERQILASLNHPNIARLLDGGVSEAGELFLVMEYIEGEPLNEYAEKRHLDIEKKLGLFLKVCRAVSFAHQNLIVHRDIKPSNILVADADEPKLLDFGLAKIADENLDSNQTATFYRAFTPSYASPEQIHGKNITTASDVYSLGVVLYELLTGEKPFRFEGKSIEEIINTVNETEPLRPSSVGNSKFKIRDSKFNEENPKSVIQNPKFLKGDLDNITLKALRKEPERRYKSVEALADDIERHLQGLPIAARANTISYRAAKFFQRNKIAVFAGLVVVLALVSGLAIALWQAKVARLERDRAEMRFADVRELSNALLFKITPKIERLEGSIEARELLVSESLKYLDSLAEESATDWSLQAELAAAYEKIGDLQGAPRQPNLSDFSGAVTSYEKAKAIRRRLSEINPAEAENRHRLALNHTKLSNVYYWTNDLGKATTEAETALLIFSSLTFEQPDRLDWQIDSAAAEIDYANIFFYNNQFAEFFPILQKTLSRLEDLQKRYPDNREILRLIGKSLTLYASGLSWDGKQTEAETEMKKAREIGERLVSQNPKDNVMRQELLRTYWETSTIYEESKDKLSFEYLQKALKISEESVKQDAADAQARENLAQTFFRLGAIAANLKQYEPSVNYLRQAQAMFEELRQGEPKNQSYKMFLGRIFARYGWIKANQNDWQSAIANYEKSAAIFREITQTETQNKVARRYLAGQYINIAEVHENLFNKVNGENRPAHKIAAVENYQRAFDIFSQLEAQNSLVEYDRKSMEKTRAIIQKLQN